jgi:hypothetical protein
MRTFSSKKDLAASKGIYDVDREVLVPDDPEVTTYEDLEKEIICARNDDTPVGDLPEVMVE